MSISDLIDHIAGQDYANAGPTLADILNDKMADALESEKAAVASAIFGDQDDDIDIDDDDLYDEDDDQDEEEEYNDEDDD